MAIDPEVMARWRALGFTTWEPFDHADPKSAIDFLRRLARQPGYRTEYLEELTAAVDLMQAMYDELVALRAVARCE